MPKANKKDPRFVQSRFNKGMRTDYVSLHGQYTGRHSSKIVRRKAGNMSHVRQRQFNTHFATILKEYYRTLPNCSEIEVQIAHVNDRYFIASNNNETSDHFYDELVSKANLAAALRQYAKEVHEKASVSKAGDAYRRQRHAKKLADTLDEKRTFVKANMFRARGAKLTMRVDACDAIGPQVAGFIDGSLGKTLCIVTSSINMHAEQKIMLALCKAYGSTVSMDEVTFAGTFRPCRGCFESLNVVQRFLLPNLAFADRPGHWWATTTRAHAQIIEVLRGNGRITPTDYATAFDTEGLMIGLGSETNRPMLRPGPGEAEVEDLHYASDSDSDDDSDF
ncbi:MAG: hypothetical protein AAF577_12535 [Pseudomonadota bacterium]